MTAWEKTRKPKNMFLKFNHHGMQKNILKYICIFGYQVWTF
jgi:hypothetical protein